MNLTLSSTSKGSKQARNKKEMIVIIRAKEDNNQLVPTCTGTKVIMKLWMSSQNVCFKR